jgi:hypothetical protein
MSPLWSMALASLLPFCLPIHLTLLKPYAEQRQW